MPTDRSRCHLNIEKGDWDMVILGIDAHKRTHTVVAIDKRGRVEDRLTPAVLAALETRLRVVERQREF